MTCTTKEELVRCLLGILMHEPDVDLDAQVSFIRGMTQRYDEVGNVVEGVLNGTCTITIDVKGGRADRQIRPLRLTSNEP